MAWRTLRVASAEQLHLFGKIGTTVNDVEKLIEAMESKRATPAVQPQQAVKEESEAPENTSTGGEASVQQEADASNKRPHPENGMEVDEESAKKARVDTVPSDTTKGL